MAKRLTHDEFVERVHLKHDGEIEILSRYISSAEKVKCRHNSEQCNSVFEIYADKLLYGNRGCPLCGVRRGGKRLIAHDEYVRRLRLAHNGEIELIGKYTGADNKHLFRHNTDKCYHEWYATAYSVANQRYGCPMCAIKKRGEYLRLSHDEYVSRIKEKYNGEIEVLSQYTRSNEKVHFRHCIDSCGYEWDAFAGNVYHVSGCPKCGGTAKLTQAEIIARVNQAHNGEVEVIGQYTSIHKKLKFRHSIESCGYEWEASVNSVAYNKTGCPICASSKGESLVRRILSKRNVAFEEQYKIPDCRNIRPLPFDFAVFQKGQLAFLCEWDGIQHFVPRKGFGGEESFELTKFRDDIKNQYCVDNNIPLLRIPYYTPELKVIELIESMLSNASCGSVAS